MALPPHGSAPLRRGRRRTRALVRLLLCGVVVGAAAHAPQRAAAAVTTVTWCGTDADAGDRPDAVATHLVRVVYAVPANGLNRFASTANGIATDLAVGFEWWRREDPSREPRFDFYSFPGCATRFGALDLASVRLPETASFYEGDGAHVGQSDRIQAGVTAALSGAAASKKYLVYYDAPIRTSGCGVSPLTPTSGGPLRSAVVFVQPILAENGTCGTLGTGGWKAGTATHELTHNLGGVPTGAPHRCPDSGHVCDNPVDNMYGGEERRPTTLMDRLLDPGRDDYYAHAGTWWDVQDSLWLHQVGTPPSPLGVTVVGAGRVYTSPAGLDCRSQCQFMYNANAAINLYVDPDDGMRLRIWEGACTGKASPCSLSMSAAKQVVARFAPPNRPPAATFALASTQRITSPLQVTSTSTDPDGAITGYLWNFGDGATASGATASHRYANPGTFRVRLTVTDDEGASNSLERPITITVNAQPTARFSLPSSRHSIALPLTVTSSARDSDGSIATHSWNFGDGATKTGQTVSHTYTAPGTYRIRLTVTDNEGATAATEQSVAVVDHAPRAVASASTARAGGRARLRFRVTDDVSVARARVTIRRGGRLVATRTVQIGKSSAASSVVWKTPKRRAVYSSCVQAWDSRNQPSSVSCAALVTR